MISEEAVGIKFLPHFFIKGRMEFITSIQLVEIFE